MCTKQVNKPLANNHQVYSSFYYVKQNKNHRQKNYIAYFPNINFTTAKIQFYLFETFLLLKLCKKR